MRSAVKDLKGMVAQARFGGADEKHEVEDQNDQSLLDTTNVSSNKYNSNYTGGGVLNKSAQLKNPRASIAP